MERVERSGAWYRALYLRLIGCTRVNIFCSKCAQIHCCHPVLLALFEPVRDRPGVVPTMSTFLILSIMDYSSWKSKSSISQYLNMLEKLNISTRYRIHTVLRKAPITMMGKTADLTMSRRDSLTPSTRRVRHRRSVLYHNIFMEIWLQGKSSKD